MLSLALLCFSAAAPVAVPAAVPAPQASPVSISPTGINANSAFGAFMDLDGDTAIVTAPYHTPAILANGSVHVYERAGNAWTRTFVRTAITGETIGQSAAIDGDVAAFRQRFPESVIVLERQAGVWTETATLPYPGNPVFHAQFGGDVAISGDRIAVGAPTGAENGALAGVVYVFERIAGSWTLTDTLAGTPGPGPFNSNPNFGRRVELEGDTLVVSAPRTSVGGVYAAGLVYVYEHGPAGWTQVAVLANPPGLVGPDLGGRGMCLDGDRLAVGAVGFDEPGINSAGIVHVFEKSAGSWSYASSVHDPRPSSTAGFGIDLSLSGDRLVVGRSSYHVLMLSHYTLAIETFDRQPGGTWQHAATLDDPHVGPDTGFGLRVRLDGSTVMAAASAGFADGSRKGEVYVADVGSSWLPVTTTACVGSICSCPSATGWGGCGNSTVQDGALTGSGSASITADDLELFAFQLPAGVMAQAFLSPSLSMPVLFGGGDLCVQGALQLPPTTTTAGGALLVPAGLAAQAAAMGVPILPGDTWYFQVAYSDPVRVFRCLSRFPFTPGVPLWNGRPVLVAGAFNVTNAVAVTFTP